MNSLIVLELSPFTAQHAETVAPAQGQLHDRELTRLLGKLAVNLGHAGVGGRQGDSQVFGDDEGAKN